MVVRKGLIRYSTAGVTFISTRKKEILMKKLFTERHGRNLASNQRAIG